jgi:hypothetical protein
LSEAFVGQLRDLPEVATVGKQAAVDQDKVVSPINAERAYVADFSVIAIVDRQPFAD